jgi:hypothetical protein
MTMVLLLIVMDSWISGDISADVLLSPLLRFIVVTLFLFLASSALNHGIAFHYLIVPPPVSIDLI